MKSTVFSLSVSDIWLWLLNNGLPLFPLISQPCMPCLAKLWPTQCPFNKRLFCLNHPVWYPAWRWLGLQMYISLICELQVAFQISYLLDNSICTSHRQTHLVCLHLFHVPNLIKRNYDTCSAWTLREKHHRLLPPSFKRNQCFQHLTFHLGFYSLNFTFHSLNQSFLYTPIFLTETIALSSCLDPLFQYLLLWSVLHLDIQWNLFKTQIWSCHSSIKALQWFLPALMIKLLLFLWTCSQLILTAPSWAS